MLATIKPRIYIKESELTSVFKRGGKYYAIDTYRNVYEIDEKDYFNLGGKFEDE